VHTLAAYAARNLMRAGLNHVIDLPPRRLERGEDSEEHARQNCQTYAEK
jgi:hypothetical protein